MADIRYRVKQNKEGKFYVEWSCIYCELCTEIAPEFYKEDKGNGWAYVHNQPKTNEEIELAMEALIGCPTESIGSDGDKFNWKEIEAEQDIFEEHEIRGDSRDIVADALGKRNKGEQTDGE